MVHVEDLEAELVALLLQGEAGVVTTGRSGTDPDVGLGTTELGEPLDEVVQRGRLERDLDEAEGFSDLTDAVRDVVRRVKL